MSTLTEIQLQTLHQWADEGILVDTIPSTIYPPHDNVDNWVTPFRIQFYDAKFAIYFKNEDGITTALPWGIDELNTHADVDALQYVYLPLFKYCWNILNRKS